MSGMSDFGICLYQNNDIAGPKQADSLSLQVGVLFYCHARDLSNLTELQCSHWHARIFAIPPGNGWKARPFMT